MYIVDRAAPKALADANPAALPLPLNKWYFDELYDFLFVRRRSGVGRLFWKGGDGCIIDGLGPDGVSARVLDVTRNVVRLQTGYVYHYAFAMLLGVARASPPGICSGGSADVRLLDPLRRCSSCRWSARCCILVAARRTSEATPTTTRAGSRCGRRWSPSALSVVAW